MLNLKVTIQTCARYFNLDLLRTSAESEDYVDSDFVTEDENDDDDDDEAEDEIKDIEKMERKKGKKGAYVDPAKRPSKARMVEESDSDSDDTGKASSRAGGGKSGRRGGDSHGRTERSFRSTTTMRSEASKSAATEAQSRKQEQGGRARGSAMEERRLTQEELLAEAAQTALENEKDLQASPSSALSPPPPPPRPCGPCTPPSPLPTPI